MRALQELKDLGGKQVSLVNHVIYLHMSNTIWCIFERVTFISSKKHFFIILLEILKHPLHSGQNDCEDNQLYTKSLPSIQEFKTLNTKAMEIQKIKNVQCNKSCSLIIGLDSRYRILSIKQASCHLMNKSFTPVNINPLDTVVLMANSIQSFVHDFTPINMSNSSEEFASELLENLEEMFPRYYMHSDIFSMFKSSTTPQYVIRRQMVNTSYDNRFCECKKVFSICKESKLIYRLMQIDLNISICF